MAAIQDFDYLGFRQQVRDAFPETQTVPRIDRLMEIDRIRRGQGRPPTQAGEAIRQVYADVIGSLDALFTGINPQALQAHVSRETPSPYYRTPLQRGEPTQQGGPGLGQVARGALSRAAPLFSGEALGNELANLAADIPGLGPSFKGRNSGTRIAETLGSIPGVGGVLREAFDIGASPLSAATAGVAGTGPTALGVGGTIAGERAAGGAAAAAGATPGQQQAARIAGGLVGGGLGFTAGTRIERAARAATEVATPGRNVGGEVLAPTQETTPVAVVTRAIEQVKPLQEQNAELLTEFRAKQALGFEAGLAQGEGQAAFRSALAGMRGQAERVSFTPLADQFDEPTITGLFNRITQAGLDQFEHANAGLGLEDLLAGRVPTPSDLAQLEKAFPGITASLQKAGILTGPGWRAEVRDLGSLPQSVVSAFDFSAYRQVATSAALHPRMFARVWRRALDAAKSEENFNAYLDHLNALPSARLRVRAGVSITRGEQALSGTERTLVQRALGRIPGYKFSTRHYAAVLDGMRAELFDRMVRGYGDLGSLTQKELRQWGRLVNTVTGRGDPVVLGSLINESRFAGTPIFWAPRLILARAQLPFELFSSSPTVRAEAAKQLVAFVGINATLVGVGAKAGLWQTSLDPRSADFMQIRLGNQRIDPWAGFRPIVNLIAREVTGERTSTITGETTDVGRRTIVRDFLQTKLSPLTGTGVDVATGRDQLGNPYNPLQAPIDLLVPLFWRDVVEAAKNQGAGGAAGSLLSGVGLGVNTYAPSPFDRAAAEQGFSVPYVSLAPAQKLQVDDAHPELVDARSAEIIARGGPRADYERLKIDLRAQQEASDANLAAGTLTPGEWRDQRGTRLDLLRGAREIVFANAPKDAKDAIGRYYQQVDASQLADGTVDWDAVEVWLTQQTPEDQKLIDENTGIGGTQTERTYRSLVRQLDQSGYYALGDGAWASVQAHAPAQFAALAGAYATFGDWAAAAEEAYRKQLVAGGTPSGVARQQATVALQRHPMYRAYLSAFDTLHKRYTQAHPLLLDQAADFGLGSLDAAEKRYLTLVLGQGQTP